MNEQKEKARLEKEAAGSEERSEKGSEMETDEDVSHFYLNHN